MDNKINLKAHYSTYLAISNTRLIRYQSRGSILSIEEFVDVFEDQQHDSTTRPQSHHLGDESFVERSEALLSGHHSHRAKCTGILDLAGHRLGSLKTN